MGVCWARWQSRMPEAKIPSADLTARQGLGDVASFDEGGDAGLRFGNEALHALLSLLARQLG